MRIQNNCAAICFSSKILKIFKLILPYLMFYNKNCLRVSVLQISMKKSHQILDPIAKPFEKKKKHQSKQTRTVRSSMCGRDCLKYFVTTLI